jgi:hypothetical protein
MLVTISAIRVPAGLEVDPRNGLQQLSMFGRAAGGHDPLLGNLNGPLSETLMAQMARNATDAGRRIACKEPLGGLLRYYLGPHEFLDTALIP